MSQNNPTINTKSITPWYITGFTNADGCFSIHVETNRKSRFGYQLKPTFSITQHEISYDTLEKIRDYFQCGKIITQHKNCNSYVVNTQKELDKKIIPHFEEFPVQSAKNLQFAQICTMACFV